MQSLYIKASLKEFPKSSFYVLWRDVGGCTMFYGITPHGYSAFMEQVQPDCLLEDLKSVAEGMSSLMKALDPSIWDYHFEMEYK